MFISVATAYSTNSTGNTVLYWRQDDNILFLAGDRLTQNDRISDHLQLTQKDKNIIWENRLFWLLEKYF